MSLPDFLLDEPDCTCPCGNERPSWALYCRECMVDSNDLYADEALQDRLEGRRK
jgi:hypothetical protein